MIEVVYKTGVYCRHHPYIGFLYSFSVFVLVFDKYLVVGLIASDVCIFLDDATKRLVEILEEILCLAEQTVCRPLIHVEAVVVEEFHYSLHRHCVYVSELCQTCNERAVIL